MTSPVPLSSRASAEPTQPEPTPWAAPQQPHPSAADAAAGTGAPADLDALTATYLAFARSGQADLLDQVLRGAAGQAYTQARRQLGNAADADDAVQEAFLQLVRTAPRFDGRVPFAVWLGQLVRTACLRLQRSARRLRRREAAAMAEAKTVSEAPHDGEPTLTEAMLHRALAALPERDRAAIELHYFAGLSQGDVGAAIGVSENAVALRLSRAREKLRRVLAPTGGALAIAALLAQQPVHAAPPTLTTSIAALVQAHASGLALPATLIVLPTSFSLPALFHQGLLLMRTHPLLTAATAATCTFAAFLPLISAAGVRSTTLPATPSASPPAVVRAQAQDWTVALARGLVALAALPVSDDPGVDALVARALIASGAKDPAVQRALAERLAALLRSQDANGFFAGTGLMYGHALATRAIAEAEQVAPDPARRAALLRAGAVIITAQNPAGGWRYTPQPRDADSSASANVLLALHALRAAGITIPGGDAAIARGLGYLARCTNSAGDGRVAYMENTVNTVAGELDALTRTAAMLACRYANAEKPTDAGLASSHALVLALAPRFVADPNAPYAGYGTMLIAEALHRSADPRASPVLRAIAPLIAARQLDTGLWSGDSAPAFTDHPVNASALASALAVLALQDVERDRRQIATLPRAGAATSADF